MNPNRRNVVTGISIVLAAAVIALMAHWGVQPLILITP